MVGTIRIRFLHFFMEYGLIFIRNVRKKDVRFNNRTSFLQSNFWKFK